ncbi:MAG: hypothetical protein QXX34_08420 [Candidatus Bathyarchaeia archaeon]
MQTSKKTLSLLITALFTLSMILAAVPLVSAAVTVNLSASSGKVGDTITVTGSGANPFGQVTIYWDSTAGQVLNTTAADNTGAFTCKVKIPSAINGGHFVVAQDSLGQTGGAAFTVIASLALGGIPPVIALPGDSLAVTGHGYSANKAVTIHMNLTSGNVTLTSSVTTNSTGSFSTTVVIPSIAEADFGPYHLNATDTNGINATAAFTVDYYIKILPIGTVPPGVTVTLLGRISANKSYELRIDTTTIATGTTDSAGNFMKTYQLPTLIGSGPHTATIVWDVTKTRSTSFSVGNPPSITLGAPQGVAGTVVSITGTDFSASANITLTFDTTVVNSTATDARFGPTSISGTFSEDFAVPNLTPGPYVVKVTDQNGASAQTTFTILPAPTTTIALRSSQYLQGDTLSFNVYTTETSLGTITVTVTDPTGGVWWSINTWALTPMGTYKTIPYADQVDANNNPLKLPDDAPTGSWNWTVTYTPASTGTLTKATGLFTVSAKPTLASVQAQINQLSAQVNSLGGNLSSINSQLSSISSTVSGISGAASSAASAANSAKSAADSAKSAADAAKAAADAAKASADSAASAIEDAKTAAQSAASAANAAKSSADSAVSAIEDATTAAESAKAAAEGVSMAVWIAVVLSLVAAIAAIFAVITIRGKIAG